MRRFLPGTLLLIATGCAEVAAPPLPDTAVPAAELVPQVSSGGAPAGVAFKFVVRRDAQWDSTTPHVLEDLEHPRLVALRPLVSAILSTYGLPRTDLDKARALRDWVARTAVTTLYSAHPDNSVANLEVLPPGATWADLNQYGMMVERWPEWSGYWWQFGDDGTALLQALLGDFDAATGTWVGNGVMRPIGPARFQIRDLATYPYVQCSFQAQMLVSLWAAAGLRGMLVQTINHDGAAVFVPDLGKWVWEDPTFNEEYWIAGGSAPLSPLELFEISADRSLDALIPVKTVTGRMRHDQYVPYGVWSSFVPLLGPHGFAAIGLQVNGRIAGLPGRTNRNYNLVSEAADGYVPIASVDGRGLNLFPGIGARVLAVEHGECGATVRLGSSQPNTAGFEYRVDGSPWRLTESDGGEATLMVPATARTVEVRTFDSARRLGAPAHLERVGGPRLCS